MEGQQQRGRSPSGGHQSHNINHSPSPHRFHSDPPLSGLGLDPFVNNSSSYANDNFQGRPQSSTSGAPLYNITTPYIQATQSHQLNQQRDYLTQDQGFRGSDKDNEYQLNGQSSNFNQPENQYQAQLFDSSGSTGNIGEDFTLFRNPETQNSGFENQYMLDPSLQTSGRPQQGSVNPADLISAPSPHNNTTSPPSLLPPDHSSPGQHSSPSMNHQSLSPNHSRHTSLDPASAAFPQGQSPTNWTDMLQGASFQGHRRAHSEHSDVSSTSPSPFLSSDNFEPVDRHSPLLSSQDPSVNPEALGIEHFNLSDQSFRQGISPGHSPAISPRISPQQGPGGIDENPFMISNTSESVRYDPLQAHSMYSTMYNNQQQEAFPAMGQEGIHGDNKMAPPEINIEFAGPSRTSSFEPKLAGEDDANSNANALFPPPGTMTPT